MGKDELTALARVVSVQKTVLSSWMPGRIKEIDFREMAVVPKGAVLFQLDCVLLEGELEKAEALLEAAQRKTEILRALHGMRSLGALDVALAESEGTAAEATVNLLRLQLSRCAVRAPFSGVLSRLLVDKHQYVTQGQPVLHLVSLDDLEIEILLKSEWLSWLKEGLAFEIDIKETADRHRGHLVRIDSVIDFNSQTIRGRGIAATGQTSLLPGMSGTAIFERP